MLLIGTEDDGLAHPVGLLEVLRNLMCHLADATLDDDVVVVVGIVIFAVFDKVAVDVSLPSEGTPSFTNIGGDIDESIKKIRFDIFAIGEDQLHAGFQRAREWCNQNGKRVVELSRTRGISSSQLRVGGMA